MNFDRKARPKIDYWKQHSIAKQNSFTLPLPEREVHHYDMRVISLPCPILHAKVIIKLENGIVRYCCSERDCIVPLSRIRLCLKGKRFAGAKT